MKRCVSLPRLLIGAAASLLAAGCEVSPGEPIANTPPETYLNISGASVDTTGYVLDLAWWGADRDGDVAYYEFRLDSLWSPAPEDTLVPGETRWVRTRRRERSFVVPVRGHARSATFTVLAVDDAGAKDPTPVVQTFHVRNAAPVVRFGEDLALPARSLPAVTFSLAATDADGDDTVVGYRVWFEGQDPERDGIEFPGARTARITLGPSQFPGSGVRTVNIQAKDVTDSFSDVPIQHTWEIIDTEGKRLLVVDQHPDAFPFGAEIDAFYESAAIAALGTEGVVFLNLESDGAFRTEEEIPLAFSAFDALVWYSGLQAANSADTIARIALLRLAKEGIVGFAQEGGRVFLQSTFAFGDGLPRSEGFATAAWDSVATYELLGLTRMQPNPEGNSNFLVFPGIEMPIREDWSLSPLRAQRPLNYVDFFNLPFGTTALTWIPPNTIHVGFDPLGNPVQNPTNYYCGFEMPFEGGGVFLYSSIPLPQADGNGTADDFLGRVLLTLVP